MYKDPILTPNIIKKESMFVPIKSRSMKFEITIAMIIASIIPTVGKTPIISGNVLLPAILSPRKSLISPRGPKTQMNIVASAAAYIRYNGMLATAAPPIIDASPAPAELIIVLYGKVSLKFVRGWEYMTPRTNHADANRAVYAFIDSANIIPAELSINDKISACLLLALPDIKGLFDEFILSALISVVSL